MAGALKNLLRRDNGDIANSSTMQALLVVLLVILIIALSLVAGLMFFRQRKRARKAALLPMYDEKRMSTSSTSSTSSHHRRIMVRPSESIYVYQGKQDLIDNSSNPPSPNEVPEIRITFPEEVDDSGKRQSGRVVVVKMGESTVGMEPVTEEKLPAYEKDERFQSLDLDRIGGLEEKPANKEFH
ncbi:hypothetical protein KC331_g14238 [Hortaea werneckii]|uniref:Uncharacterized protein n=1 Tax=Hortaea werneckii TaxID=91943 RepID=A0A3M7BE07_HORWE|nr:hypothetical protein KC349_g7308 [Hortaea werneckii]KAI7531220.1 hypothetical protein KC331_g14238 [Hortaea werneckii]RMY37888.1 hypothetical protein D0865_13234 [Hortaea werneckii]